MIPKNRIPTHPGEILLEEFLIPMGLSQVKLAAHINQFLERVYGEPLRLSDLPLQSGLSSHELESIKKYHLEPVGDQYSARRGGGIINGTQRLNSREAQES